jgi:uncharacterized protein (DUF58 family)
MNPRAGLYRVKRVLQALGAKLVRRRRALQSFSRRQFVLFALIVLATLLGLMTKKGSVIALSIPLFAYIGVAAYFRPDVPELVMQRALAHEQIVDGQMTLVGIRYVNRGSNIEWLHIDDSSSTHLSKVHHGDDNVITSLRSQAEATLKYGVVGQRGEVIFTETTFEVSETFGLFGARYTLPTRAKLVVVPEQQKVRSTQIRPPRTKGFNGPIPSRTAGPGVDFFGMREYQGGDRMRAVNWRATERYASRGMNTIFTNLFEQERIANIGFILDARNRRDIVTPIASSGETTPANTGPVPPDMNQHDRLFEHSLRATASLANSFLGAGHRVGLLIYGPGQSWVVPGYGPVQRLRIETALGKITSKKNDLFGDLRRMPVKLFTPSSQLVFVGPCLEADVVNLIELRAKGYAVLVVAPDPIQFELRHDPMRADDLGDQLALRIARLTRNQYLQDLKRGGVQVIEWDVDTPLDQAVRKGLAEQPIHRLARMTG